MAMQTNGRDGPKAQMPSRDAVAIVTGGSFGTGRKVARTLASWSWAIVVVYLDRQSAAEATVAEILAAGGRVVTVRADLADDLDVERLFAESSAAFAGVDVVVHASTERAPFLYQHAARHLRPRGAIVSVSPADHVPPAVVRELGERGISVGSAAPEEVLSVLDRWRQRTTG
jgi:3-oxoacyl-[acyl-carrier protein] reductase